MIISSVYMLLCKRQGPQLCCQQLRSQSANDNREGSSAQPLQLLILNQDTPIQTCTSFELFPCITPSLALPIAHRSASEVHIAAHCFDP